MKGSAAGAEALLLGPYVWADPMALAVSVMGKDAVGKIELFANPSGGITMQAFGILG